MINPGIHSGDILILERALEAADDKVVLVVINGELTVKRISIIGKSCVLWLRNMCLNQFNLS
jgi:DNA polymerase V